MIPERTKKIICIVFVIWFLLTFIASIIVIAKADSPEIDQVTFGTRYDETYNDYEGYNPISNNVSRHIITLTKTTSTPKDFQFFDVTNIFGKRGNDIVAFDFLGPYGTLTVFGTKNGAQRYIYLSLDYTVTQNANFDSYSFTADYVIAETANNYWIVRRLQGANNIQGVDLKDGNGVIITNIPSTAWRSTQLEYRIDTLIVDNHSPIFITKDNEGTEAVMGVRVNYGYFEGFGYTINTYTKEDITNFDNAYSAGKRDIDVEYTFGDMVESVPNSFVTILKGLLNFELPLGIFSINLFGLFTGIVTCLLLVFIVRKITK